jgi:hypothetical protein
MYETGDCVICRRGGVWRVCAIEGDNIKIAECETGAVDVLPIGGEEIVRKISSKETVRNCSKITCIFLIKFYNSCIKYYEVQEL